MKKINFMRISYSLSVIIPLIIVLYSCKEDKTKQEITQIIKEWQGKEIVFPENPIFTQFGNDTITYQIPESEYKIVYPVSFTFLALRRCKASNSADIGHYFKEFATQQMRKDKYEQYL